MPPTPTHLELTRRRWAPAWPVVGMAATLILLAACAREEAAPEPVRAVRTLVVGRASLSTTEDYAAEVRARVESRLGFRVPGKIVSRAVEAGQRVKAGQALATLDPGDLRLGQEAAQAALRAAQVQLDQASAEFKRFKELRDQNFISAIELERREAALNAARAQAEQAKAQADVQRNQASYAVLAATADGVVTAVESEVGAVLAAGTPVIRLAHEGPRDAVFSVPEDRSAAFHALLGRRGAVQVRPWAGAVTYPATVREVAAAADPVTRTYLVKADLGTASVQLGQTVVAVVEPPRRDDAIKLPLAAVMQNKGQSAVWLLDAAAMTVKVQPVVVAGADGNEAVIARGLEPGQTVVTAGVHVLTPGQKVRYFEPAAPSPTLGPAAAASR